MGWFLTIDGLVFHRAIYLTGPTAAGKTAIGVELAIRLGAEVLALDSMTLYRGLDIGTAKPTSEERGGVPHHLIDVIDPWQTASVAAYRQWAAERALEVESRAKRVLFVGGTPLYLKALLRGLFVGPGADPELRARLELEAQTRGLAVLHQRLAELDPALAARLHPHDQRRIVRALEVIALSQQPLSVLQAEHDRPAPAEVPVLALDVDRVELNRRINARVERFFEHGLLDEARRLRALDRPVDQTAAQAIGYREAFEVLDGKATQPAAIERIQARTRQFAKRQRTWFRGLSEIRPFAVAHDESPQHVADRLARRIEGWGKGEQTR